MYIEDKIKSIYIDLFIVVFTHVYIYMKVNFELIPLPQALPLISQKTDAELARDTWKLVIHHNRNKYIMGKRQIV